MLARADSSISLTSLEEAKAYKIGAYKGDAISEHLIKQGVQPLSAPRDQENHSAAFSPWLTLLLAIVFPVYMWLTALTSRRWQRLQRQEKRTDRSRRWSLQ